SASLFFGSHQQQKVQLAAELVAVLCFLAQRNHDKVGLVHFSDQVKAVIPPRKGRGHQWQLIREVLASEEEPGGTSLKEALQALLRMQKRKTLIFVISDFLTSGYENELRLLMARHEVVGALI